MVPHRVLRMRLCQSHISCYPSKKPPAYGTEGALDPVSDLADGNIDTLLSFGNFLAPVSLAHDATYELSSKLNNRTLSSPAINY